MHQDDLANAIKVRKAQLQEKLNCRIPDAVINGGTERAKAFKDWAVTARRMIEKPEPSIEALNGALSMYHSLQTPDWQPPLKD